MNEKNIQSKSILNLRLLKCFLLAYFVCVFCFASFDAVIFIKNFLIKSKSNIFFTIEIFSSHSFVYIDVYIPSLVYDSTSIHRAIFCIQIVRVPDQIIYAYKRIEQQQQQHFNVPIIYFLRFIKIKSR